MLVSVSEFEYDEKRDMSVGARPDRLSDQRTARSFVPVLHHGKDVHEARLCASVVDGELGKTDQRVAQEGSDENTAAEKRARVSRVLSRDMP